MRRLRTIDILVALTLSFVVVATTTQCRTPTQVILEVRTDAECHRLETAIFVGATSAANGLNPIVTRKGCEEPGFIGSAVLLPSNADDEAFAAKIITAVDVRIDECVRGTSASCIVERRAIRYEPNEIVRVTVNMDQQCIGVACAPRETCQRGACVPCVNCVDQTLAEAGAPDAIVSSSVDSGNDDGAANIDAEVLAGKCEAPCTSCAAGTCVIDCKLTDCTQNIICPAKRRCQVDCNNRDAKCISLIDCTKANACDVTCSEENDVCSGVIECGGKPCRLRCIGPGQRCNSLTIRGKPASFCLECIGSTADKVCNSITCEVPTKDCSRNCSGCNDQKYCEGCKDLATGCPPPQ